MPAQASDPTLWKDELENTPPLPWQAVTADGRWWFNAFAPGDQHWVQLIAGTDGLPATLEFSVEITHGADSPFPDIQLVYSVNGNPTEISLGNTPGTYPASIDTSAFPAGVEFKWTIQTSFGSMYSGIAAVLGPDIPPAADFNCECDDDWENATLAELRARVIARCGFVAPPAAATATLAQLRTRVTSRLGFMTLPAAQTGMQLSAFRSYLMARLGFAAQIASPPPGMNALLDALVNEAQQLVWRRYAYAGYSASVPPLLVGTTDACTLDSQAIQLFALAAGKAQYGQPDAKGISDQAETYLKELLGRSPPNLTAQVNQDINSAIQTIWRRFAYGHYAAAAPAILTGDSDTCTIDAQAVELLATGLAKGYYGQADGKIALDQYETYIKELGARSPPGLVGIVNDAIASAQQQLYRRHASLRTERFYAWTMTPGQRYYGITDNEDACPKKLDVFNVSWVGVEDLNGQWIPLLPDINPVLYSDVAQTSLPARYEIRSCIEVFPAPDAAYKLRVKGNFGLLPLVADADTTTLDPELIYLWAMGLVKGHYQQPDAKSYFEQAQGLLGGIVAGSHQTRRYVPGKREPVPYIEPRMDQWDYE